MLCTDCLFSVTHCHVYYRKQWANYGAIRAVTKACREPLCGSPCDRRLNKCSWMLSGKRAEIPKGWITFTSTILFSAEDSSASYKAGDNSNSVDVTDVTLLCVQTSCQRPPLLSFPTPENALSLSLQTSVLLFKKEERRVTWCALGVCHLES